MKKAFTLIELLVVIAIMGMMGAVSVGGYRAMRRGMEERSVMQNANQFIRTAYQRAQIDRMPVAVYFWNETLNDASGASDIPVVVGRAVAVRQSGRISKVQGSSLYDEFGDLKYSRLVLDEDDDDEEESSSASSSSGGIYLYPMARDSSSSVRRSVVAPMTTRQVSNEPLILGGTAKIESYAYDVIDAGGVQWKAGDAYGFEFADLTLPRGYLFGQNWSRDTGSPVAGETKLMFKVGVNTGSGASQGIEGADTIAVYSLRPDKSGGVSAQKVASTESPAKKLGN